ncbi:MAG: hypothetical protein MZV65_13620 [Chromatiales bacterium]|nr:hypothetical protein [Chromatiales bacterium]
MPLEAKVAESLAAYRAFHAEWDARLAWQESVLRKAAPDLVLADVPYLSLAAAARLDIPRSALCSLNWADILAGYCADAPDLEDAARADAGRLQQRRRVPATGAVHADAGA